MSWSTLIGMSCIMLVQLAILIMLIRLENILVYM